MVKTLHKWYILTDNYTESHILIDKLFLNIYNLSWCPPVLVIMEWCACENKCFLRRYIILTSQQSSICSILQTEYRQWTWAKNTPQATVRSWLFLLYCTTDRKRKGNVFRREIRPLLTSEADYLPHTDINISSHLHLSLLFFSAVNRQDYGHQIHSNYR